MDNLIDADHEEILFETSAMCTHDRLSTYLPDHTSHIAASDDGDYHENDDDVLQEAYDGQLILFEGDHLAQPVQHCEQNHSKTEGGTAVPNREWVIERIEDMLEGIVDGLLADNEQLTVSLKTRAGLSRRHLDQSRDEVVAPPAKVRELNYPGNNAQDAWRFTVLVRILELIHSGLIENTIMTKRDMYYRHPDLFGKQVVVDQYVDDIACTLGVSRALLNVTAAARGLVAGNFAVKRTDDDVSNGWHGLNQQEGGIVPIMQDGVTLDLTCVRWVLIIEKEATFRSLLSSDQWQSFGTHGLVITAKGFPDLHSRHFLRHIAENYPYIPMHALVDLDPDGIHIMSTYKYGSLRLTHEQGQNANAVGPCLPNLQWLGVQSHQVGESPGNVGDATAFSLADTQGIMKLSARDRRKAHQMLEWDVCGEVHGERGWRAELQRLLMLNIKAEMQILDERPEGLVSWLSGELEVMGGESGDDEILF